jgi:hypothetical protein
MEELVKKAEIVDGELVKAVGALLPGESLERILDTTRYVLLKRAMEKTKSIKFSNVIHLIEHLKSSGLTVEDVKTVLTWMIAEDAVSGELRTAIESLLDSGLLESVFKFVCEIEPFVEKSIGSCCCLRPRAD